MLRLIAILLCIGLSTGTSAPASAEELVAKFTDDRSMQTRDFEIDEGPWLIDWIVNSEYPQSMGIGVALVNAKNGVHLGKVVATKVPGNGVRLLTDPGVFYFKIDSTLAYWTIKVIKLTPEEAGLYKPKAADDMR